MSGLDERCSPMSKSKAKKPSAAALEGHTASVNAVAVTTDGAQAVAGSDDNTVRVWDLSTVDSPATLGGHTEWVNAVAVTADGARAVSGSNDNTVRVWDLAASKLVATLEG